MKLHHPDVLGGYINILSLFGFKIMEFVSDADRSSILAAVAEVDIIKQLGDGKLLFFVAVVLWGSLSEGLPNGDFLEGVLGYFFEVLLCPYWQVLSIFVLFQDGVAERVLSHLLRYAFLVLDLELVRRPLVFASVLELPRRGKSDVSLALTEGGTVLRRRVLLPVAEGLVLRAGLHLTE